MENLQNKIHELVKKYENEVINIRRDIHEHPELSFQEFRTSEIVAEKLNSLGLNVQTQIAKTGVTAVMEGNGEGKTLLLRADMDALPINEETQCGFKSVNKGVMHACGHDIHTANLLGVAMILSEIRNCFKGRIKFVFQPAEESGGGGREMIKEGILDRPKVDAALGMHIWPGELGKIVIKYGNSMAYSDGFTLNIKGKKAHSSTPEKGVDAIVIASQIVVALQSVIARNISPFEPSTFSIGKVTGGTAFNVVPDYVSLEGMMRNVSGDARQVMRDKIEGIAKSIAVSMGGDCEFLFKEGYPAVINDKFMTDTVKSVVIENEEYLKKELDVNFDLLQVASQPVLGAEDFGFYTHKVPSCYFFVGAGEHGSLHTSEFTADERLFKSSLNIMSLSALRYLEEEPR